MRLQRYNQPVVKISSSSRSGRVGQVFSLGLLLAFLLISLRAGSQAQAENGPTVSGHGRILLVLPFDNRTGQPSLEWIREASAELLSSRLAAAGFAPMSRADRRYALDHLGLPQGFHPSRATSLKLAETLDADSIVVGSYVTDGTGIVAEAQLVDVPHLRMGQTVTARGEMRDLISVFGSLAWMLTRQLDPQFKVSEQNFVLAGSALRLDAFEQYIRGISEPDQAERLRHLNQSVLLSPEFSPAWMALGREDYAGQHYEQAAEAFAKVGDPGDALEAGFFRGLSLLFSGNYPRASEAFAGVARQLPLAEVLNNQGVALARGGKDGAPLFRQAVAADPNSADYHFNLAVSLRRHNGNDAEALAEVAQCLRLRPNDSEALAVQRAWTRSGKSAAANQAPIAESAAASQPEETEAKPDPLERIERNFDAAAFRQAALMLDQVEASKEAALPPNQRAQKLSAQAHDYLDRGLSLEAERIYQSALAVDPKSAEAHAGLAEMRERAGNAEAARKEAVASLELMPSVDAYLVMARLDLATGHMDQVNYEIGEALKIDPKSRAALDLQQQIAAKDSQKK
jgi:tetratricopeptide (TPR) repeat protein/nucleotide-binding universal stress UspA family protein